ncbi:MAG: aminotransferase class IV [Thermoflavifilum sp.]|nr:aminotransferase class IV [Thermoflavifilum sp.]
MPHLLLNGKIFAADIPLFTAQNRAFRYGDGFFETIKCLNGKLMWWNYHRQRIQKSLRILQMPGLPETEWWQIEKNIFDLCRLNDCLSAARIRISFFRANGGKYTPTSNGLNILIDAEPMSQHISPATGIVGGVAAVEKPASSLSPLKSLQCLPYILAGMEAQRKGWDQAILLNTAGRIAETHVANLFCVHDQQIITPPLSEGCVEGIIRQALLDAKLPWPLQQRAISLPELLAADEVFATNTIQGIQYFRKINDRNFVQPRISLALMQWLKDQENELSKG